MKVDHDDSLSSGLAGDLGGCFFAAGGIPASMVTGNANFIPCGGSHTSSLHA
jgi:hypothetical protein